MPMNAAYLSWYLSGGTSNTDPNAALGGAKSSTKVLSQSATAPANITGVAINDAVLNPAGDGTLAYDSAAQTLTWTPNGGSAGSPVSVASDGDYAIPAAGAGYLDVTVTAANLPSANASDTITVAQLRNQIFDDILKDEAVYGDTEYRCLYFINDFSDQVLDARVWVEQQPNGQDGLEIAADPAGIGDGSSSGVAQTVGGEGTAPSGVTFSAPADYTNGVQLGDFPAGQGIAVWIKRHVPSGSSTATSDDLSRIGMGAQY